MWGCSFGFKLGCDLGVPLPCPDGICCADRLKLGWNQIRSDLVALVWDCAWTKKQRNGGCIHIFLPGSHRIFLPYCVAAECNPWSWRMSLPSCIWMYICVISSAKNQGVSPPVSSEMISGSSALKCSAQTLTNLKSGLNSSRLLVDQKRTRNRINCFQLIDCFLNSVRSSQILNVFPLV